VGEQLLRPVEADDREVVAEHLALASVQEQLHVLDVRLDERLLELEVEVVDEGLHLLAHARGDPAAAGRERQVRARHQPLQVGDESLRDGHDRGDPARGELLRRLLFRHPDDLDVLADVADQVVDAERLPRDGDPVRDAVLVDERDTRLRVGVRGGQPDQERDQGRADQDPDAGASHIFG